MLKTYCAPVCFTDHANCDLRVISKNSSRSLGVVHFTSQETSTVQWPARLQLATRRGAGAAGVRPPPIVRSYRRRAGAGRAPNLFFIRDFNFSHQVQTVSNVCPHPDYVHYLSTYNVCPGFVYHLKIIFF